MAGTSRGATLLGPDKSEIREYSTHYIASDGGLVKIEMGGVCGSDFKYFDSDKNDLLNPLVLGRVEKLAKDAPIIHGTVLKFGMARRIDKNGTGFFQIVVATLFSFVLTLAQSVFAQQDVFTSRVVVTGLNYPWQIVWGQDTHLWITERY